MYTLVMAEGGYDPTTENKTPWEDHGIDHDDDDEQEVNTTQPFQPGASSTPYHEGEAHEMANMGEEGEGIPLLPSSITGAISRTFFHSMGLPLPGGRGNPLE